MEKPPKSNISLTIKKLMESEKNNKNINNINEYKENIIENSINHNNDDFDNLDINSEQSHKSYQSMFSIISKNGNDPNDNLNEELESSIIINNNCEIQKNISFQSFMSKNSESIINNTNNNNKKISFWEALKLKLSDFKNKIIFNYNIFSTSSNLNYTSTLTKEIQIFDEKYTEHEKLLNKLKNIPWFSYRKDFEQIKNKDDIYTSDAGWGCMLRASQMILAQGLCKISSIDKLNVFINQYLAYFYDNKIPIKLMSKKEKNNDIKNEEEVKNEDKKINTNNEIYDDFEVIDKEKYFAFSFIDVSSEMINGLENMSKRRSDKEYLIPPFSLRSLIKVEKHINKDGKKVGEWFSNYDTIRLIQIINQEMNSKKDCDFQVLNFNEGVIYIEDIIKNCFEEYIPNKDAQEFELLTLSNSESDDNFNIDNEQYIYNDKKYQFKKKFIMFISVRHGLYLLDEDMYSDVLKIFDIETNIGFIGGKNTRAFYFIGRCENNVIFLDPHYVQNTIPLNKFGTDSVQDTYIPNDIFYMPIKELSPSFTIGFAIKDMKSFKKFMKSLHSQNYFQKNKFSNKTLLFLVKNTKYPLNK